MFHRRIKVNSIFSFNKTVPINIAADDANALATIFGCSLGNLPFSYLGLPLGTTRPSVHDLMQLVSRLDRRLSGISSIMTYTGRLTLLNTTHNEIHMFAMCCLKIPITIFWTL
jgi:hypothetical protein